MKKNPADFISGKVYKTQKSMVKKYLSGMMYSILNFSSQPPFNEHNHAVSGV